MKTISKNKITETLTKENVIRYAQDTSDFFCSFVKFVIARTHDFSLFDFAVLKLCLVSFGLYLGSKFANFFKKFHFIIFISFILSTIYMLWRVFMRKD